MYIRTLILCIIAYTTCEKTQLEMTTVLKNLSLVTQKTRVHMYAAGDTVVADLRLVSHT